MANFIYTFSKYCKNNITFVFIISYKYLFKYFSTSNKCAKNGAHRFHLKIHTTVSKKVTVSKKGGDFQP